MRKLMTKTNYDRLGMIFVFTGSISAIALLIIVFFDFSFSPMYLILLSMLMVYTGIGFAILDTCQLSRRLSDMHHELALMIDQYKEKEKEIIVLHRKILILDAILRMKMKN